MQGLMLGQILLSRRLLIEEQLARALAICRNTRTRLGDVLIGEGMLGYKPLYEALAAQLGLEFVDLLQSPPSTSLLDATQIDDYLRVWALPCLTRDGRMVIATSEYSDATIEWAKKNYGENIEFALTSPIDIHKTVQASFTQALTRQSTMGLFDATPESSALSRQTIKKWLVICAMLILATGFFMLAPASTFIGIMAVCQILYAATMIFKTIIYTVGIPQPKPQNFPPLSDEELPVYTVLIPMYKETESMPHLLSAMHRMDYPPSKLDIKLVLEEDDDDTLDAAYALHPRYQFDIIRVPASLPRTKPKACNYALRFARGEYVTVYDADDRPDPKQLKKAAAAFKNLPPDVVCLQARLNYYNLGDNLLTRLFSLEYSMLFYVLLHGISRLGMPVLLGGTSNHISLARLKELGEWDPFNVTEDADLGTRLAARGFKTMMLDSTTMEEAPNSIGAWFRQRSRWIKGYIQTWLVHMRHPLRLLGSLKIHGFLGFQFFVALSSFSYLTAPLTWLFALLWLTGHAQALPGWLYALSIANLGFYLWLHMLTALHLACRYRQGRPKMLLAAIFYPFYLVLHSIASYLALWQLFTNPYGWNKTSHGKSKTFSDIPL